MKILEYIGAKGKIASALAITVAFVTAAVYCKASQYNFVMWDDNLHVCKNPFLQHICTASLGHLWQHPYEYLYIPVSYMAFAALSLIGRTTGPNPAAPGFDTIFNPHVFHIASVILHSINAVLAFYIVRRAVKSDIPSAIGALLFAVHPLQVESVAWISELRGLLSATLGLSSILFYWSCMDKQRFFGLTYIVATTLFLLSILAKPDTAVIPLFLLLWQVCFFKKASAKIEAQRLTPWFVIAALDIAVSHFLQPPIRSVTLPLWERGVIAVDSLGFYIDKFLWPFGLTNEYGRTPVRVLAYNKEISTGISVAVAVALCLAFGRSKRWIMPSALTAALFLLPTSGIVPFAFQYFSTVADRYVYLALLGPSLILAFALNEAANTQFYRTYQLATLLVLTLFVWRTEQQLPTWQNTQALFTNTLAVNPYDWLAYNQLGYDEFLQHDFPDAEKNLKVVATLGRASAGLYVDIGEASEAQGHLSEAVESYNIALSITPNYPYALADRSRCLAEYHSASASTGRFVP